MEKNNQILKQLMRGDWVATGHGTPMRLCGLGEMADNFKKMEDKP